MTANYYKKAIEQARAIKSCSLLDLTLQEVKESFYNEEITHFEFEELRKMIFGL